MYKTKYYSKTKTPVRRLVTKYQKVLFCDFSYFAFKKKGGDFFGAGSFKLRRKVPIKLYYEDSKSVPRMRLSIFSGGWGGIKTTSMKNMSADHNIQL